MEIQGKYNKATIFTNNIDEESIAQVYNMLNNPSFANSQIAIMPDVHVGKGSVVGFTMQINEYINPSVIGVDIGCGIDAYNIGKIKIDFSALDIFIKHYIPSGRNVHNTFMKEYFTPSVFLQKLIKKIAPNENQRIVCAVGSLGGGNHFIELDKDDNENIWLVIHSGSRNLGLKVCHYHQLKAKQYIKNFFKGAGAYNGMEFMPLNEGGEEYLEDMKIVQNYAENNRYVMSRIIIEKFFNKKISQCECISSIHNYLNFEDKIIRKGAISAKNGQKLLIPLNMRDGVIIATGKGNQSWNYSAPHGAGRLLRRSESKQLLNIDEYKKTMKGIYSSCINEQTIDESPMAYKPKDEIISLINDSVDTNFIMTPVYNFKAGGDN